MILGYRLLHVLAEHAQREHDFRVEELRDASNSTLGLLALLACQLGKRLHAILRLFTRLP